MQHLNEVTLIGNLGKDPEVRSTQDGRQIVNLSVATSEQWKDKQTGERRERTEWHRVVIFNEGLGGVARDYLRKGAKVMIRGKLQTRKWTDQSGMDRYTTEVVMNGFDSKLVMLGDPKGSEPRPGQHAEPDSRGGNAPEPDPFDDEVPF